MASRCCRRNSRSLDIEGPLLHPSHSRSAMAAAVAGQPEGPDARLRAGRATEKQALALLQHRRSSLERLAAAAAKEKSDKDMSDSSSGNSRCPKSDKAIVKCALCRVSSCYTPPHFVRVLDNLNGAKVGRDQYTT